MAVAVSPNQDDMFAALATFLGEFMPADCPVVRGQINRVPEPGARDFVVMWLLRAPRLTTNIDSYEDVAFTASIAGTVMTVTSLEIGTIEVGALLYGTGVNGSTTIGEQLSGTLGGIGTYAVGPSQNAASQPMAAGGTVMMQPTDVVFQIECHGEGGANNAQVISTMMRDAVGVARFNELNPNLTPLYADDPRQVPFINENQQYEDRWIVEAHIQANQSVRFIPTQFADAATIELIEVETEVVP